MEKNSTGKKEKKRPEPQILPELSWRDLHSAKFAFNTPFQLRLKDDQILFVEQLLRIIPKRRLVVMGSWSGKLVVAKLFVHSQFAIKHLEKEFLGHQILKNHNIPTALLYDQNQSKDHRIQILIFAKIENAKNLQEIWANKANVKSLLPLLEDIMIEIATQHVLGVVQRDLHLKNFLLADPIFYTLDGAGIEKLPFLLSKKMSMQNLALFFSQLGLTIEPHQEKLFRIYARARGWLLKQQDIADFIDLIKKCDDDRWQQFKKKIFRESSHFVCVKNSSWISMIDREYATPEFLSFVQNPEMAFSHPTTKILKSGSSSTVVHFTLNGQTVVVKRYNLKNFRHRLRRLFRSTRANTSWRLAQKLKLFDFSTAKPVAFIEKRVFAFRDKSYFVTEYISGEHAGVFFKQHQQNPEKINAMIKKITTLLKNIAKMMIIHGDLKITNILINHLEQPVLIDLDGATEHPALGLNRHWRKEIKRFLKNFEDQPEVHEKFKKELNCL